MCASCLTDSCVFCTFFKMPLDFLGMHNFKPCKCWVNSTPADSTIRAYSRPQVLSHTCSPVHLLVNRPATLTLLVHSEKSKKTYLFFLQIYPWNDVPSSLFVHAEKSWKKSSNLKKKIIQKKDETNSNFAFWWTVWFWNICCICILVSKLIKMKLKIWFRKFLFRKT